MNYTKISINTALPEKPKARVMIIYTGGTFGMAHDTLGVLVPFNFSLILEQPSHLAQFVSRSDGDLFRSSYRFFQCRSLTLEDHWDHHRGALQ